MFHPARDGCRGGRDKFDWDEVKKDKQKMNYLGNSVKAQTTRGMNLHKEIDWASAGKKITIQEELAMEKEREAKMFGFYLTKGMGAKPSAEESVLLERSSERGPERREERQPVRIEKKPTFESDTTVSRKEKKISRKKSKKVAKEPRNVSKKKARE